MDWDFTIFFIYFMQETYSESPEWHFLQEKAHTYLSPIKGRDNYTDMVGRGCYSNLWDKWSKKAL